MHCEKATWLSSSDINWGLLEQNGFARKKIWVIDDNPPPLHRNESSGRAYTDLLLKPSEEDLKIWPHRYDFLLIQYPYIVHMHHEINKIIKLSGIRNIMIWFISTWIVDEEVIQCGDRFSPFVVFFHMKFYFCVFFPQVKNCSRQFKLFNYYYLHRCSKAEYLLPSFNSASNFTFFSIFFAWF